MYREQRRSYSTYMGGKSPDRALSQMTDLQSGLVDEHTPTAPGVWCHHCRKVDHSHGVLNLEAKYPAALSAHTHHHIDGTY